MTSPARSIPPSLDDLLPSRFAASVFLSVGHETGPASGGMVGRSPTWWAARRRAGIVIAPATFTDFGKAGIFLPIGWGTIFAPLPNPFPLQNGNPCRRQQEWELSRNASLGRGRVRTEHIGDEENLKPCPACPDGSVWTAQGPSGATCPVCKGYAVVTFSGEPCAEAQRKQPEYVEDYRYER